MTAVPPGATATAFLARTSGLDGTHTSAYTTLLNGLDSDSLTSKIDVLHVYATQDSTTALLNLVSSSFNGTANGSPTFTADRGFTGVTASTTVYIDTGFNPASGSPQYAQNSAHISTWNLTTGTRAAAAVGCNSATPVASYVIPQYTDNNFVGRVNNNGHVGGAYSVATPVGHYLANRSGSTTTNGYGNAVSLGAAGSTASAAVPNFNFYVLAQNNAGSAIGVAQQIACFTCGASLNSTEVSNLYSRLRTYMTAVGVP